MSFELSSLDFLWIFGLSHHAQYINSDPAPPRAGWGAVDHEQDSQVTLQSPRCLIYKVRVISVSWG